jgi:hypothetical protein
MCQNVYSQNTTTRRTMQTVYDPFELEWLEHVQEELEETLALDHVVSKEEADGELKPELSDEVVDIVF